MFYFILKEFEKCNGWLLLYNFTPSPPGSGMVYLIGRF
jgi:hypothetical protein